MAFIVRKNGRARDALKQRWRCGAWGLLQLLYGGVGACQKIEGRHKLGRNLTLNYNQNTYSVRYSIPPKNQLSNWKLDFQLAARKIGTVR